MARIGKIVTFDGSKETISDVIIAGMALNTITDVNWSFPDKNTMHIYGEQADLSTLKAYANGLDAPFIFDIGGDAPAEAVPTPDPTPTPDEITANAELKASYERVKEAERQRLHDLVETDYMATRTTNEPYRKTTDWKHLR